MQGLQQGKGDKKLSDLSEVEKSRRQLEELQEKKNMVDMVIQWKNGLNDTLSYQVNQIEQVFCSECGVDNEHFSESFKKLLRRSIRKYGFDLIIDAIYIAVDYYPTNNKQARENALSKNCRHSPQQIYRGKRSREGELNKSYARSLQVACNEP